MIELLGTYRNHKFIVRGSEEGWRCGYVSVTPIQLKTLNVEDLTVHGDVTWNGRLPEKVLLHATEISPG